MKVYINRKKSGVKAVGEFDLSTRNLTVLKGSVLSAEIAYTEKFRGAKSVEKSREGIVKDCVLQQDIIFKSASTATNFVTGSSTHGLTAWKDEAGRTIKDILLEVDKDE